MYIEQWHTKDWHEVLTEFSSAEHGLSEEEVRRRLRLYGLNKLPETKPPGIFSLFISQWRSPLIYVLVAAGILLLWLRETIDAGIIFFVLLFNALVGTLQEGRAERTLLAIKNFTETNTTVLREGKDIVVADTSIVQGDIVLLQEGDKVPADGRVIASHALLLDEAALTGESTPVAKTNGRLHRIDTPLAEKKNMVFKGTNILSGNGMMIVTSTGASTFIGRVTETLAASNTEIPLHADIRRLSRLIIGTVIVICAGLFLVGFLYGREMTEMFKMVVALSVSIIPEGLPIVITLVLAAGVWRMSKKNVLVKKLQAVEALGQARIIAVDKTGTITKNELTVEKIFVGGQEFSVSGVGYEPEGELSLAGEVVEPLNHHDVIIAAKISSLVPNARLSYREEQSLWKISGDPTEAAMIVFAEKMGFHREILEEENPRIFEIPFDYRKKCHVAVHKSGHQTNTYVAGAPEAILPKASSVLMHERSAKLDHAEREALQSIFLKYAGEGLRVIALAEQKGDASESFKNDVVSGLTFVGFLCMRDVPRPEARDAVARAREAGMKVVMITGDHLNAAQAVAKEAGIYTKGDRVLTGEDIEELSESELSNALSAVTIFARVTPEHKLNIIRAYKGRGEIIAMTGDGVNDAPSLATADLGIAMGKMGTEVAKEASDIVILNDDFGSIVAGIEEGRNIYKTIKKVILYLFSTSIGEVLVIVGALGLGLPLPVLAAQIIWLNLVTDGFLDVSLAMDPKEHGLLGGTFKHQGKYLVDTLMIERMVVMAIPMALGTLSLFAFYLDSEGIPKALTVSLTTLAVFQWFNAWNCRSERLSIFRRDIFSNTFLLAATGIVITLQFVALYTPFLQKILRTVPLNLADFGIIILVASSIVIVEEIRKYFYRQSHRIDVSTTR